MKKIFILFTMAVLFIIQPLNSCFAFTIVDPKIDPWNGMDKVGHFGEHVVFAWSIYAMDRAEWPKKDYRKAAFYSVLSSISLGFLYETVNGFIPKHPHRIEGFSAKDFICDIGGSITGTGLAMLTSKQGSPRLHKIIVGYRKNALARFCAAGLVSGVNYVFERTAAAPGEIDNKKLFWNASLSILLPDISLTVNQLLFFPKKENIDWKNITYDIAGSLVGTLIACRYAKYNQSLAAKFAWTWRPIW